ncbi:hypothetical protein EWH70_25785 [Amycolatopsis suaedae]|uniref:VOC family protein n=1 Tax=Amycolatopsis suaedae TaxID=2510978 RepID=A0A4Q7J1P0_9PSEU|nr:hypothetical protein EWH70_25785 [Amycolatopsis suaedae]
MRERAIPGLPCRQLDDVLPFYTALGFAVTFRQDRPNPYASVRRGGIELHFFGVPGFDPAQSMGSTVVIVPDTAALHADFAAGLRAAFGKVPVSGIPRMTRPRRKSGAPGGFSVVDPGGNWLRISSRSDDEAVDTPPESRLARVVATAARQGDSHGDVDRAIDVLRTGLARHAGAPPAERLPALVYLAELQVRAGDRDAAAGLLAEVRALELTGAEREAVATDLATAAELAADLDH